MFESWSIFDWVAVVFGGICLLFYAVPRLLDFATDTCYELAKLNGETVGGLSDKYFLELTTMPQETLKAYDNATTDEEKIRIVREYRQTTYL